MSNFIIVYGSSPPNRAVCELSFGAPWARPFSAGHPRQGPISAPPRGVPGGEGGSRGGPGGVPGGSDSDSMQLRRRRPGEAAVARRRAPAGTVLQCSHVDATSKGFCDVVSWILI